jgi:hypothetical protein
MSSEGGEDLDWFWRGWYSHNWRLDLAAEKIDGNTVTIANNGQLVLPATVEVRYTDGTSTRWKLPVETWESKGTMQWTGDKPIASVVVDPDKVLPDDNRSNNSIEVK